MVKSTGSSDDLKTISAEIQCQLGQYVILVATILAGEKGRGSYKLEINVEDIQAKLAKLPLK